MRPAFAALWLFLSVALAMPSALAGSADDLAKAKAIFETLLVETPDDPDIPKYLGEIAEAEGDATKARSFFEEYAARRPDDYYGFYKLGELSWSAGHKKEAKAFFERALGLIDSASDDLQARIAAARMVGLMGDHVRSDERYAALLEKHPDNVEVPRSYVDTLVDEGRNKRANQVAKEYSERYPQNVALQRSYARVLALRYQYAKARHILSELMERYPQDAGIRADYAYTWYDQGNWYRAKPLFEQLAAAFPDNRAYRRVLEELFIDYRPSLSGGFDPMFDGQDTLYASFLRYRHPLDEHWLLEAGYELDWGATDVVGYDPSYSVFTHSILMGAHYKPYWTVDLNAGLANEIAGSDYYPSPRFFADWNDPRVGHMLAGFVYHEMFDDPVAGLYFDGKQDRAGFAYDRLFLDRIAFNAAYESIWYYVNGAKVGRGGGDELGRNDIVDTSVQFIIWRKPEITLGYQFYYSKLHVVNDYLDIIPLIPASEQNNILYGFSYEWNKWVKTDFGGFVGNDSKRNLKLSDLDYYGFHVSNRFRVSKRLDIIGHYEYSSESAFNTLGRYQYFGVNFIYRF
jgi:tetratricopeptide (TPR) repeat protein